MPKMLSGLIFLLATISLAGEPDQQLRTPLHWQHSKMAGWIVVPDWTVAKPRTLFVFGHLWRYADKSIGVRQWTEIMGGGLANRRGGVDPIINIRAGRASQRTDLYAEALHNSTIRRTTTIFSAQVHAWRKARLGAEIEQSFGRGKPTFWIGPKITIPFFCGSWKCAVSSVYFLKSGTDTIRTYTPITAADW